MKVSVLYGGKGAVEIDIPERNFGVLVEKRNMPVLEDPTSVLKEKLRYPTGTPPLKDIARGKRRACIVISDNTRPVPNELLLEGIIDEIKDIVGEIRILIANGLHKKLSDSEIEELVGERIASEYEIINHEALNDEVLVYLGETPRGTPIYVNKYYIECDLKILTGLIEPHFMAGYSGGRKSVCPGIAGYETVKFFHSPALLESPKATNCVLDENPVHEEAMFVARKAGVDFIVNVAIDSKKRVSGIFAGDPERAWLEGVEFVSRFAEIELDREYDIVITSNSGYPLDRNYYQTVKGLVAASGILKRGGVIVMASECRDGLGSGWFRECLRDLKNVGDYDEYIEMISKPENFKVDQWEVEELVKVLRVASKIFLMSEGLSDEDWDLTFAERISDLNEGLHRAFELLGEDASVAVIPEGPYVIPRVKRGD